MGSVFGAKKIWPRYGDSWSVVEDKRLRRIHKKLSRGVMHGKTWGLYERIGRILGRTPCAVATRLATLKAVDAHLKAKIATDVKST